MLTHDRVGFFFAYDVVYNKTFCFVKFDIFFDVFIVYTVCSIAWRRVHRIL